MSGNGPSISSPWPWSGYVTVAGISIAGFIAFVAFGGAMAFWPMLALAGLAGVYGIGLAVYQRRT